MITKVMLHQALIRGHGAAGLSTLGQRKAHLPAPRFKEPNRVGSIFISKANFESVAPITVQNHESLFYSLT